MDGACYSRKEQALVKGGEGGRARAEDRGIKQALHLVKRSAGEWVRSSLREAESSAAAAPARRWTRLRTQRLPPRTRTRRGRGRRAPAS